ncbi:threonine aldolase family protein [Curvivirga aplysinae]|uniref:threonine aldolase family protein n=1 Tax=Curvivirga aplysinae TaxID=2529852 RepID=UPI0012BC2457|nr:low specificity L-threonine aldolase [Curvivirga aplysinae]MTI09842.1 low specificity L-threonine aldolase [Curvivirga aplysinae]
MNFASDNSVGANPEIIQHLLTINDGGLPSYGDDEITQSVEDKLSEIFERKVAVFPVATGTAANVISLSAMTPSYGSILCHSESHIQLDECNAPEMFTDGAKLITIAGENGKMTAKAVQDYLDMGWKGVVHHAQPSAISITQATESGTVYLLDEIKDLTAVAKQADMNVHMDGARFTNALRTLGCTPAEMTWKAGVDVLSFGATKNGCLNVEAIVVFDPDSEIARQMPFRRKRGGHLFSKMRYLSAQLEAYLENDLWIKNADYANDMAKQIADAVEANPSLDVIFPVEANIVFSRMKAEQAQKLYDQGFYFYEFPAAGKDAYRMVTSWVTKQEDISKLVAAITEI